MLSDSQQQQTRRKTKGARGRGPCDAFCGLQPGEGSSTRGEKAGVTEASGKGRLREGYSPKVT